MAGIARRDIWGFLFVCGCVTTLFGYQALRGDQASRLFHLMAILDSDLFTRDWYVQGYQEMNPHLPYFFALGSLVKLFDWFPALLIAQGFFLAVLFAGGVVTYRALRPADPYWAAWLGVLALVFCQAGDLGVNPIFESQFKPRMMANAFALLAVGLMLKRPLQTWQAGLAGTCVILCILAHLGVGLLIVGLLSLTTLWWCLEAKKSGIELRSALLFLLLNGIAILVRLPYLLGVDNRIASGPAEVELMIQEYILGHPGHFYPPAWPPELWLGALALVVFALSFSGEKPAATEFRLQKAGFLVAMIFVVGLFNSSFLWVYKLVLIQPFRLVTLVRSVLAILVATEVARLWNAPEPWARERAALILTSLTDNLVLAFVCVFEIFARRRKNLQMLGPPLAIVFSLWQAPKTGLLMIAGLVAVLLVRFCKPSERSLGIVALVGLAAPMIAMTLQLFFPSHDFAKKSATRWQFLGLPSLGLERVAYWAQLNTEKDSLFLTPPGVPGFRVWARRAIVLDVTTPPLSAPEIREHNERKKRFQEILGAPSAEAKVHELYEAASLEQLYELASFFETDYIVTLGPRNHSDFRPVFQDGVYYVYQLGKPRL